MPKTAGHAVALPWTPQPTATAEQASVAPARLRLWQHLQELGDPAAAEDCLVNGQPGRASLWIYPHDHLQLAGHPLPPPAMRRYFICHKPVGVDCNVKPGQTDSIWQLLQQLPAGVFPVGRLDKDSCGLLLLTNDGAFAARMLHPSADHQKTYQVDVDRLLTAEVLQQLAQGLLYQAGPKSIQARPCHVRLLSATSLQISLTEGKNRQIRYMLKTLGYRVLQLQRTAIGQLVLPGLQAGQWRALSAAELLQAGQINT
jgi:pseudouridine synthase